MKVLTFSRLFPVGHPKVGELTYFVEKIWKSIWDDYDGSTNPLYPWWENYDKAFPVRGDLKENIHQHEPKHTTIRAGNRWKVGDMASLRVWSDKPYRSKQVEFAQVEVKEVIPVNIYGGDSIISNGVVMPLETVAQNDGLLLADFKSWFHMVGEFTGQIISWNENIKY